tara:strand:- start:956 stop:1345 length:390 start_codon:yes stop_codon:yes gene_type:complete
MKITRRQIRGILKEAMDEQVRVDDLLKMQGRPHTEFKNQSTGTSPVRTAQVSYSPDFFRDTIVTGPEGDTVIFDGDETYIRDIPEAIKLRAGFPMSETDADNLIFALEDQMQDGRVELEVTYENGKWSW